MSKGPYRDKAADNAADFACQSDPIDIIGPGSFALNFPVPSDFLSKGYSISASADIEFKYQILLDDVRTGVFTMSVVIAAVGFVAPYAGFSVWIY